MQVVDGMQVHVLSVPRKGGLPHSEVEIGSVDTVDLHVVVLVHPVQDGAQFLDVPMLKNRLRLQLHNRLKSGFS